MSGSLQSEKDGEKIGFYKFSFVGEGPYNQKQIQSAILTYIPMMQI